MTKKDFIALADAIKREGKLFTGFHLSVLADFCKQQNPQFDRARWLNYIAGKCGPGGGKVK